MLRSSPFITIHIWLLLALSQIVLGQGETCSPWSLGSVPSLTLNGIVVTGTYTQEPGAQGQCPEGPCWVKFSIIVDLWADPSVAPKLKLVLCIQPPPTGTPPTVPPLICFPTTLPPAPPPSSPNSFRLSETVGTPVTCGDTVGVELKLTVPGPYPGMDVTIVIASASLSCSEC
jgi:hypothetical protein